LCEKENGKGRVMVLTGDLDTLQLVNNCIHIYTIRKGLSDMFIYDPAAVRDRFGLRPDQMLDYKALRGDPSDNIKGVTGIGEKGAAVLIKEFGSIDKLYEAIHSGKAEGKIKPKTLQLLIDQEKDARFAHELSTIICNVEMDTVVPSYEFTTVHLKKVLELFHQLEFQSLVTKLPKNYLGSEAPARVPGVDDEIQPVEQSVDIGNQNYILIDSNKAIDEMPARYVKLYQKRKHIAEEVIKLLSSDGAPKPSTLRVNNAIRKTILDFWNNIGGKEFAHGKKDEGYQKMGEYLEQMKAERSKKKP
jgi:hypothetical protein